MWGMTESVYADASGRCAVALLVLFPAAAPAGIVAADLWFLALDLCGAGRAAGAGEDHRRRFLFRRRHRALDALDVFPFAFALDDDLRFPEVLHHAILNRLHHLLEDLERLLLVLDEREGE